ncbi:CerR family C-terminal domain-containing protein [Mesorhizobium australicum]|uniref:Transcriptional regulator, TetR family n=1 Tax=Mesorhizobium australicum TaxID=536018 RepID=A0A1X7MX64_9HYPH|nr:CerR family C-terminal domain-containing protein [Mesorhizobium australicum]SMH29354.1 transcriptional regulator, TetR family [Mesorhizobium australicum]
MSQRLEKPEPTQLSSAEQTRLALIRAALTLFGRHGYDATTTREIAAAARANIGSIAYHFGGKDGLHAACAQHIVETIRSVAGDALEVPEVAPDISPEQAGMILEGALSRMVAFIVARPEGGEIVQFILRELNRPTSALNTIYFGVFEPVHKRLCAIWSAATGEAPDSQRTLLTVFTLLGQVVYFRIGREAVSRRMSWKAIGPAEADAIADVTRANLRAILAARRAEQA